MRIIIIINPYFTFHGYFAINISNMDIRIKFIPTLRCFGNWRSSFPSTVSKHGNGTASINGHFRNLNWKYLPYVRPIFQAYVRGYPHKIWPYMVLTYLHFRILKFPLIINVFPCKTTFILDFPWRCLVTGEYS